MMLKKYERRMFSRWCASVCCGLVFYLISTWGNCDDQPQISRADAEVNFEKTIRPILVTHCWECHGDQKQEAGLRLDSRMALLKPGDNGPAIDVAHLENSNLIRVIDYADDLKMPPKQKLSDAEIAALRQWVLQGAIFPESATLDSTPKLTLGANATPEGILESKKNHWAYQSIRPHPVPEVQQSHWPLSPIDNAILAKLESQQLVPSPVADRRTILRRVSFDLQGLPATQAEVFDFENDAAPDAYERQLDRLLASPHYGERWGRHWLDVARYADTKGYVFTEERKYPFSYTYRDYVINAFNQDVPYDLFIKQQIAADQLPGSDQPALAAMGFLTVGRRFGNNQHDIIDDRIDVVSRGLMGLTVTCARCHDHKYDAIPIDDYYSLYGVFASSHEPAELPQLGEPADIAAYQVYEQELQKRKLAVQELTTATEGIVKDQLRAQTAAYLRAVWDSAAKPPEDAKKTSDELQSVVINRWKNYLTEVTQKPHTVFSPWQKLVSLPREKFTEQAAQIIAELNDAPETEPRTNFAIKQALQSAALESPETVAQLYGELFTSVHQEWLKLKETGATALPDSAREEIRQILYADNGPLALTAEEAKQCFDRAQKNKIRDLQKVVETFQVTSPAAPPRAMVMVDAAQPMTPHVFLRGNPGRPGKEVPRQFFQVLQSEAKPFTLGSGRLELAEAIASSQNPLTARVLVNRIWQQHFGKGLVRTSGDFGFRGEQPSHPELLDTLAFEFMHGGWSIKRLHRSLLQSAVYRQASTNSESGQRLDPDNRLLWKMPRRRLEFEPYRDALLAVAGQLDDRMLGRTVDLFKSPYSHRRAVYGFIDRQDLPGTFRVFDFASPDVSTPQRAETIIPQQLLFGMNSAFVIEQSRELASQMEASPELSLVQKLQNLFHKVYARNPTAEELELLTNYLHVATTQSVIDPPVWILGYGFYDETQQRVSEFTPLPHFQEGHWRGGTNMPDARLGWADLSAEGGHPGGTPHLAVIRRWLAPQAGVIDVTGELKHPAEQGDGVRGRIVSNRTGLLKEQNVFHGQSAVDVSRYAVNAGETIDFVVDCLAQENSDGFQWSPTIRLEGTTSQSWSAKRDFRGPVQVLNPWEQLAQALLLANEFLYLD